MVSEKIKASPVIKHLMAEKKVKISNGYYDLDDGKVTILED